MYRLYIRSSIRQNVFFFRKMASEIDFEDTTVHRKKLTLLSWENGKVKVVGRVSWKSQAGRWEEERARSSPSPGPMRVQKVLKPPVSGLKISSLQINIDGLTKELWRSETDSAKNLSSVDRSIVAIVSGKKRSGKKWGPLFPTCPYRGLFRKNYCMYMGRGKSIFWKTHTYTWTMIIAVLIRSHSLSVF